MPKTIENRLEDLKKDCPEDKFRLTFCVSAGVRAIQIDIDGLWSCVKHDGDTFGEE